MTDTFDTIAAAYADFQRSADRAKDTARDAYQRAYDEAVHRDLQAFSRRLQQAHASGLTKGELRKATRKHNNNQAFKDLYDAYTPFEGEFERFVPKMPADDWRIAKVDYIGTKDPAWKTPSTVHIVNALDETFSAVVDWSDRNSTKLFYAGKMPDSGKAFILEWRKTPEADDIPAADENEED